MQPRPMADTSRSLFPSLRFCIISPSTFGTRLRRCVCPVFFAPLGGWNSFPLLNVDVRRVLRHAKYAQRSRLVVHDHRIRIANRGEDRIAFPTRLNWKGGLYS